MARASGATEVIELQADGAAATVVPRCGGRVGSLRVHDRELLVTADDPATAHPMTWGSFPMAPWVGRIRRGRFTFDGSTHVLEANLAPHAIHGTTFDRPWTVTHRSDGTGDGDGEPASVRMAIDLGWELGGRATQTITLAPGELRCELAVHAVDRAMPAEVGWHPWFVRPDEVVFEPAAMYVRDDEGIATATTVDPASVTGPFDDCFVNHRPASLTFGDIPASTITVTVTSDADHWVRYDEPEHAFCLEPQSGPPDAFNLAPRRLEPGDALRRTMTWRW